MYRQILQRFPKDISYAFAYGSGVKQQLGYEKVLPSAKMIDLILCVENSSKWHEENMQQNPTDYSGMRIFGSSIVSRFQENFGASIYFNTLVHIKEQNVYIKYGVISPQHLIQDLNDWKNLYVSGRLQKPVVDLIDPKEEDIRLALSRNLNSALRTALLMLPNNFSDFDLFYTIANMSYSGDFRMKFGENKHKVFNIVEPQLNEFYNLYLPAIRNLPSHIAILSNKRTFVQDKSDSAVEAHFRNLPNELLSLILATYGVTDLQSTAFRKIIASNNYPRVVAKSVKQIVWRSSVLQSIKNIPCAGISKSFEYSFRKISKMFNM